MTIYNDYYESNGLYTITTDKEFTYADSENFKDAYEEIPDETELLILNLKNTVTIDSSALGQMIVLHKKMKNKVAKIKIINSNKNIFDILSMSNFHRLFDIT